MQKMFKIYLVFFSALLGGCQQGPAATSITPGSPSQATALPTYATPTFEAKEPATSTATATHTFTPKITPVPIPGYQENCLAIEEKVALGFLSGDALIMISSQVDGVFALTSAENDIHLLSDIMNHSLPIVSPNGKLARLRSRGPDGKRFLEVRSFGGQRQ